MRGRYNERNMPGPGDPETWGPCVGHPNDPRTPDITESPVYEAALYDACVGRGEFWVDCFAQTEITFAVQQALVHTEWTDAECWAHVRAEVERQAERYAEDRANEPQDDPREYERE
jgi:hypothetical protein